MSDALEALIERAAERGAAKALEAVRGALPVGRVTRETAVEHGAPSWRWIVDRARVGAITIRGPRGRRYVEAADLEALLTRTVILHRAATDEDEGEAEIDVDAMARRLGAAGGAR